MFLLGLQYFVICPLSIVCFICTYREVDYREIQRWLVFRYALQVFEVAHQLGVNLRHPLGRYRTSFYFKHETFNVSVPAAWSPAK